MNIPLNNGYRLSSDKYQWIVQKQVLDKEGNPALNTNGAERWESLSFHQSPEKAINYHAGTLVRTAETETLSQALKAIENIAAELTLALTDQFTVKKVEI